MNKKNISLLAGVGLLATFALALSASAALAQTQVSATAGVGMGMHAGFRGGPGPAIIPGVFGTVTAINGTTLTVSSKGRLEASSTSVTVYTVDASNAKIYKDSTSTTSIASIATGDTVMVQGTVSGTNVTATVIRDGMGGKGMPGMMEGHGFGGNTTSSRAVLNPPFTGNGEPVVAGVVTAINGSTITVTNASNVTYTIDASSATIVKNGTSTAITNLATGDSVIVQGTVNGNSVTASSILDQGINGRRVGGSVPSATSSAPRSNGGFGGFLGSIGGFFKHIFGF